MMTENKHVQIEKKINKYCISLAGSEKCSGSKHSSGQIIFSQQLLISLCAAAHP